MKKSKETIISMVAFIVSVVLGCVAIVTGVMGGRINGISTIFMFLMFAALGLGLVFFRKSKKNEEEEKK